MEFMAAAAGMGGRIIRILEVGGKEILKDTLVRREKGVN